MAYANDQRQLVEEMEADLGRRLLVVPRRPKEFNALVETQERLMLYGLPPRPDKANKTAFELWNIIATSAQPSIDTAVPVLPLMLSTINYQLSYNDFSTHGHQETSRNWAGAVTPARPGLPFTTVWGTWEVPAVRAPAGATDGTMYVCSTWLGLDGQRELSWSLPQIGTTQSVVLSGGVPQIQCEAWCQWWMRGHKFAPILFSGFPVNPHDVVVVSLTVTSPDSVLFNIARKDQSVPAPLPLHLQAPDLLLPPFPLPIDIKFDVKGLAAEWIAERPTIWDSTELYPLPDFDPVTFEPCLVASQMPFIDELRAARLIRMVETIPGSPSRLKVIARSKKQGSGRVDVTSAA